MADLVGDLRIALRSFRRSPLHACVTVLILGVGLGAVTLMFSALNAAVLRPLPYPEPDRLVWTWKASDQVEKNSLSWDDYRDYRDGMTAFENLGAIYVFNPAVLVTGTEEAERASSSIVTPSFFPTLGVAPALGRGFLPEEAIEGGPDVVILSHAYWQSKMGGDPAAVGRTLVLDGRAAEIVGVMPEGFSFMLREVPLWLPVKEGDGSTQGRGNNNFFMVGRLAPGVSLDEARAQMETVSRRIQAENPEFAAWFHWPQLLHEAFFGELRPVLLLLLGMVSLVPLVACANVASMGLARATARSQELATRVALGAGRMRLVRQLLVESVLLALAGGALGLLLAYAGGDVLRSVGPAGLPRLDEIGMDGRVLTFGLLVSLLTVPIFGVYPALKGTTFGLADALRYGGGRGGSKGRLRSRSLLVVAQVALSMVLMIASGLLVRSFVRLQAADPGFEVERLLTAGVQLPDFKYEEPQALGVAWDGIMDRVRRMPGVVDVAGADWLPVTPGDGPWNDLTRPGHTLPGGESNVGGRRKFVSQGYFSALGITMLAGRVFGPDDTPESPPVMILSETLADALFPGEDPVGQSVTLWEQEFEVVGVSAKVDEAGLGDEGRPAFLLSTGQFPRTGLRVVLRTAGEDPLAVASGLRAALREMDPDIALSDLQTMDTRVQRSMAQPRFRTWLVGSFALVTLLLAGFGLYGVLAYLVAQRRHEIGIRVAVGASGPDTVTLVVREGMRMVGVGVAAGLLGGWGLAMVLRGLLYEVAPADPLTFVAVTVVLSVVALAASLVPALRAVRVSPLEALRAE